MFACCVLSGRGLCDDLITRSEESYRLWLVVVCDHEPSERGGHSPPWSAEPEKIILQRTQSFVVIKTGLLVVFIATAFPIQTWRGPQGSRRLRLPDFPIVGT
jgi:hypothetical protein